MDAESTSTVYIQQGQAPYVGARRDPNDERPSGWVEFLNEDDAEIRFIYGAGIGLDRDWDVAIESYLTGLGSNHPAMFMYFDHPSWFGGNNGRFQSGHRKYLGYDYSRNEGPVNQVPDLRNWRADAALFAHGFDIVHGTRTFQDADQRTQEVVTKLSYGLGGHAWQALDLWASFNPAVGNQWKFARALPAAAMRALCAECDVETWARRLLRNIDVTRFETELNGGKINATDRTASPWVPGAVVTQMSAGAHTLKTVAAFHDSFKASFYEALDFFDAHVAATQTPHGHS